MHSSSQLAFSTLSSPETPAWGVVLPSKMRLPTLVIIIEIILHRRSEILTLM